MPSRTAVRPRSLAGSLAALLLGLLAAAALPAPAGAQAPGTDELSSLRFRHIGPVGNRIEVVVGVPGNPLVYYAGAAAGGIFKSTDGGEHWKAVFDSVGVPSIGDIAVAPSAPNVVWAGTGEAFIRSNISIGNGVYKSTDGGETWQDMGLHATGRVSRVVIDPQDPDVVYVAALGNTYVPQKERGIYRTTDGGRTWKQVLFVNDSVGASDLIMDPNNPDVLFAGMWHVMVHTWGRVSGGHGSGIYMSRDGGDSWKQLEGNGLPEGPVGKIGLCNTPRDSNRIYALIETSDGVPWRGETSSGELWRSDDGGGHWKLVNHDQNLAGRQAYYTRCAVTTDDPDEAYFISADWVRTRDGGEHVTTLHGQQVPIWDHHNMWIDPENGDRMAVAGDGGVSISRNRGKTWYRAQLPVAQLYHVTVDNQVPYWVYTNRQDGPSMMGPSNSRLGGGEEGGGGIPRGMWHSLGGGESGFATPDTMAPGIAWSSASGYGPDDGIVVRYDEKSRQFRNVEVWPMSIIGHPAEDARYRWQWTFPLKISPFDHNTVYVGSQYVMRTTNGGQSWERISPDLTTNDSSKMGISGGLTPDNIQVETCCVVYAIDESPVKQGVIWAGTNDGLVQVTRDGGKTWTNVTGNIPGLPPEGIVRNIDASKYDSAGAYVTIDRHQMGDFAPYVYKTGDFGRHWTKITDGVDRGPLSFARNILEDPVREGLLYLGTENKLYYSTDDGASWHSLMTDMPPAPMYWLTVQPHFHDLVVGTYGRGIWILDDVTPLEQLTPKVAASDVHLFTPREAWRFHSITAPNTMFDDPTAGDNPPYGASINYWLKSALGDSVTLTIADADGNVVRTMKGPGQAGVNRVWWDLETDSTTLIKRRVPPRNAPWLSAHMGDRGWFAMPWGRQFTILSPPGDYTVTLHAAGQELKQPLTVNKDPHSDGSLEDIQAQTAMLRKLYDDMNRAAGMTNRIEWMRKQLSDLRPMFEARGADDLSAAADTLEERLRDVEGELIQLRLTGTGQDDVRWPSRLAGRIAWLADAVASNDFRPTDQAREVQKILEDRLQGVDQELRTTLAQRLAGFNQELERRGMSGVVGDLP
ncbi:MAG TPA: sialidase [Gemmatimonadota bacterium]|nr:sialidase [Gemmatimonadota bacterium]